MKMKNDQFQYKAIQNPGLKHIVKIYLNYLKIIKDKENYLKMLDNFKSYKSDNVNLFNFNNLSFLVFIPNFSGYNFTKRGKEKL